MPRQAAGGGDPHRTQGTGGQAPLSSLDRLSTGGIVPLVTLGLLALAMLGVEVVVPVGTSSVFVASPAVFQPRLCAYSAIADPSSWATLPKLKASLPCLLNRFGPIWSVPMQGAIASLPRLIASWTTGVA